MQYIIAVSSRKKFGATGSNPGAAACLDPGPIGTVSKLKTPRFLGTVRTELLKAGRIPSLRDKNRRRNGSSRVLVANLCCHTLPFQPIL